MARRAIPIIASTGFVLLTRVCVVYVVKEVRHSGGLGQLMGVACKRTRV